MVITPDDHITLFRGLSGDHTAESYVPNSLESWTDDKDAAKKAASLYRGQSHTILTAKVKPGDVLWSHLSRDRNKFIPHEDNLEIKREFTVFGHKLTNIQKED